MLICEKRTRVLGVGLRAFVNGPSVVRAFYTNVYLFPGSGAHIVDEHPVRVGLHREAERVAQAQSPNSLVLARGITVEGVVGGDRAVRVDAQHLPEELSNDWA